MDRIDDERIVFYLRNREDIDQWCDLRKEASRVLDSFLQESAAEIEALAPQLGEDVIARASLKGRGHSYIRFRREGWVAGKKVRAAIHLGWAGAGAVFFPRSPRYPAYVAVWVNRGAKGGAELAATVRREFSGRAKELGLERGGSTTESLVWRDQSPKHDEFWKDLGPFREQIIEDIRLFWREFAADLDRILTSSAP